MIRETGLSLHTEWTSGLSQWVQLRPRLPPGSQKVGRNELLTGLAVNTSLPPREDGATSLLYHRRCAADLSALLRMLMLSIYQAVIMQFISNIHLELFKQMNFCILQSSFCDRTYNMIH